MFPLRGLVPIERDGLIGISKNIGVTSIVQAALRLHGQMMLCGQAGATVAWLCLRDGIEPRALAVDGGRVRDLQRILTLGKNGPGVLLWPYHDLAPDHPAFAAANLMTLAGIWWADAESLFFEPGKGVPPDEWRRVIERAPASARETLRAKTPSTRAEAVQALLAGVEFEKLPLSRAVSP